MANSTAAERRRAPRRQTNEPLTLVVDSDTRQVTSGAFAVDLSQLGARLRAKVHLEPGQLITVVPDGGSGPKVKSRVVWVNDEGEGCSAGIVFLEPASLDESMASAPQG